MAVWYTAMYICCKLLVCQLSVENYIESENDDSLMEDDRDEVSVTQGNEAGSKDEATNGNEQIREQNNFGWLRIIMNNRAFQYVTFPA